MKKPEKQDFYNLGRYKVTQYTKIENCREVNLAVIPLNQSNQSTKTCILRDFW